jgi:hypothetical protein
VNVRDDLSEGHCEFPKSGVAYELSMILGRSVSGVAAFSITGFVAPELVQRHVVFVCDDIPTPTTSVLTSPSGRPFLTAALRSSNPPG